MQEPKTYDETINDPIHRNRWRKVVDEKLWNLDIYQTWYYIPLLNNQKAIDYNWVFKVKYNLDGSIERYKARLVIQRFFQVHRIDCIETFSPPIRCISLKIFLDIAVMLEMILI